MTGTPEPGENGQNNELQVDRAALFAAGPVGVPRKFVWIVLCAAAVLALGGALAEHIVSAAGLNPTPSTTTVARPAHRVSDTSTEHEAVVAGKLASFIGLDRLTPGAARGFSLVDEGGQTISLSSERGRIVVLTFFNARCNDICPVLAQEIELADADLGSGATKVSFLTVNTDPAATAVAGLEKAAATGLGRLANWHMLTGPLAELNSVWQAYGIAVSYNPLKRTVLHNDVMYMLDGQGRFRFSATPFADESRPSGTFELPSQDIAEFARGIASYVAQLEHGK